MGKSSSQVVGYRYYAKFAAFIGNRIEKLIGINFDNRKWVIHDPLKHPPNLLPVLEGNLFGENEGGVSGQIDIHFGYPDPEPNATYKQYFPLVSGYPYQSYLIFRGYPGAAAFTPESLAKNGFYLGNSGYMKEMLLWVKRIHVKNDGNGQWYDLKSEVPEIYILTSTGGRQGDFSRNLVKYIDGSLIEENMLNVEFYKSEGEELFFSDTFGIVNSVTGILDESIKKSITYYIEGDLSGFFIFEAEILIIGRNYNIDVMGSIEVLSETHSENSEGVIIQIKHLIDASAIRLGVDVGVYNPIPSQLADGNFSLGCRVSNIKYTNVGNKFEDKIESGDIGPIHKIREILTDDTAMGKPEADINNVNFTKAANRVWDEGLGISWAIDEKSCIEAIEELCYHIEAGIRVNRQTGLYEMVLFRDDWFDENEIHAIAESKIKNLSLEVMNSDDIVNQLNVTYYDRERIKNSTFSIYENGSILTMGHANAESVEFPYFMNMRNAEVVANWKLKQFSTPAWAGSFTTGWREVRKWNRYDLIRLPWSSKWNGTILARIMKINLGNGTDNTVTIDFEEVIPYSGEMNTSIVVDTPVDAGPQPPQPSINAVFEAPYYLTVLRAGQTNADLELSNNPDIGYVAAIAAKPQSNSLNGLLYTDDGVGEFEQVSRLDYCDILQLDQPIVETSSSFTVTGSLTQITNSNNLILLNGELMGFVSFDVETKVLTVKRGVLDTVPKKHNSGDLFIFDLPDVAFDSTQYAHSEIIEAQVLTTTPSGIQELSATGVPVEIQARAIRPYPSADVKINGRYWPAYLENDLVITWVNRNRLQQTGGSILGWFDGGVTLEQDTQTMLTITEYDANNTELSTQSANVTAVNTFTLLESGMSAGVRKIEITLKTVRDGYECLNPFTHSILISNLIAPSNVAFEVIEL